jgi:beta-phosphoglucomutase-like phosphatase (HAD superfamily)
MVARSKPAPDLLLHAAKAHGVRPKRCVVVEDSLSGVAAAQAVGIPIIGFVGGSHCRPGHADVRHFVGNLNSTRLISAGSIGLIVGIGY